MNSNVYSIGHSNHDIVDFIEILRLHDIDAIADVRSHPYSRFVPQYSRESLKASLEGVGISYAFLGKELGARSDNPACYVQGRVQYDRLARQPVFSSGIKRIVDGMQRYQIALMCAEKDPIECHRALLVGRDLFERGVHVAHIHADGEIESHNQLESRMLKLCKFPEGDMFKKRELFVEDAYVIQGQRVAYLDESLAHESKIAAI